MFILKKNVKNVQLNARFISYYNSIYLICHNTKETNIKRIGINKNVKISSIIPFTPFFLDVKS